MTISIKTYRIIVSPLYQIPILAALFITACDSPPNNPYPAGQNGQNILYQSFSERPKHLDPAVSYSADEYDFIAQIYEPPLQYHYLKRPYELIPLTAVNLPEIHYLDRDGKQLATNADIKAIAYSEYIVNLKPNIHYQPHPALARSADGHYLYHHLTQSEVNNINTLADFKETGTRELTAEDYVYEIKRLAHPKNQSPIAELMKTHIVGFAEFAEHVKPLPKTAIKDVSMAGVAASGKYQYRIRINGKYPQFRFWLAMLFFSPIPWEADVFYSQPGLAEKNITLDWYPIGTGAYWLAENNPNRQMILKKNPNVHTETYPTKGESNDQADGLLADAGKPLPFIDEVVFTLEKETIPRWTKFLQGYFDASGIASDSFDQAVQFSGEKIELTHSMRQQNIQLATSVETSIFYTGFNMLDATVGGYSESARKLRQAIAIAIDGEEFISIFMNGRGLPAQGALPPGLFGFVEGQDGINPYIYDWQHGNKPKRKPIAYARQLMQEAGYPNGINPKTGQALILNFDTTSTSIDDRPRLNWYRKQFAKLGINLVIRDTDSNRFQDKIRNGNAQIYSLGWNADYPDPENFFFLLYGGNGKVKYGGENASNYQNPEFDRLFEQMRNRDDDPERYRLIQQMQEIIRRDSPWIFNFYPKRFTLAHSWFHNRKPNAMANNGLKYLNIDATTRERQRQAWNQPVLWPLLPIALLTGIVTYFAVKAYQRRTRKVLNA